MKIGQREIGDSQPPYIVAEISGNHGGSLSKAKELIRAAQRAGADAVKTQCYEPDTITLDMNKSDFIIQSGLWQGRTLYELYSKAYTPFKWHKELYRVAQDLGITIFSSGKLRLDAARARVALAKALATRADDVEIAKLEAQTACSTFQELGASRNTRVAEELLRTLGGASA